MIVSGRAELNYVQLRQADLVDETWCHQINVPVIPVLGVRTCPSIAATIDPCGFGGVCSLRLHIALPPFLRRTKWVACTIEIRRQALVITNRPRHVEVALSLDAIDLSRRISAGMYVHSPARLFVKCARGRRMYDQVAAGYETHD